MAARFFFFFYAIGKVKSISNKLDFQKHLKISMYCTYTVHRICLFSIFSPDGNKRVLLCGLAISDKESLSHYDIIPSREKFQCHTTVCVLLY